MSTIFGDRIVVVLARKVLLSIVSQAMCQSLNFVQSATIDPTVSARY